MPVESVAVLSADEPFSSQGFRVLSTGQWASVTSVPVPMACLWT